MGTFGIIFIGGFYEDILKVGKGISQTLFFYYK